MLLTPNAETGARKIRFRDEKRIGVGVESLASTRVLGVVYAIRAPRLDVGEKVEYT